LNACDDCNEEEHSSHANSGAWIVLRQGLVYACPAANVSAKLQIFTSWKNC
jgi:hypothetical protein